MIRVTFPFYQVLQASAVEAFVEDGFDFIFRFVLTGNMDREWWRCDLSREFGWRGLVPLEQGDVEYRVDLEIVGQLELVCRGGDDFDDGVWTDELRLKFLEGSLFFRWRVEVSGG